MTAFAALIALIATWGTSRLAVTDMLPDLRVLSDVGAAPRTRRKIAAVLTLTIALLGALVGALAGVLFGTATAIALVDDDAFDSGAFALTVPWLHVAVIAILTPLVTTAAMWLLQRGDDWRWIR